MNSGKTFYQTSINTLKKRRCCHKCCERTGMHIAWICLAVKIYNKAVATEPVPVRNLTPLENRQSILYNIA